MIALIIKQTKAAIFSILTATIVFGIVYPGIVTLILQLTCPHKANGSLLSDNNVIIGSELIGQAFNKPGYFWGRPSATSPLPYDPSDSKGSNLCPANPKLISLIHERIDKFNTTNVTADDTPFSRIPVDLVTASASGLDPHISIASAHFQLARVAKARGVSPKEINAIIQKNTLARQFGFLGEPRVNVLKLNLDLDHKFNENKPK